MYTHRRHLRTSWKLLAQFHLFEYFRATSQLQTKVILALNVCVTRGHGCVRIGKIAVTWFQIKACCLVYSLFFCCVYVCVCVIETL